MKEKIKQFFFVNYVTAFSPLLIICTLFFCGAIVGTVTASYISDTSVLTEYLTSYMSIPQHGDVIRPSFWEVFKSIYAYHILVFIFGFTSLGSLFIPLISVFRGFLFSLVISSFYLFFGAGGLLISLAIFLITFIFALPCYFIVASNSFYTSTSLFFNMIKRKNHSLRSGIALFHRSYFIRCAFCTAILLIAAILEYYLTPFLIKTALNCL